MRTAKTATNADEEAPPPLPRPPPLLPTPTQKAATASATTAKTTAHRIPPPGYNRPAPLAGEETLSAAARAWVELSASLDAAEALLKPAAGEAFWGHAAIFRARFRVLTPAPPPPLWPPASPPGWLFF